MRSTALQEMLGPLLAAVEPPARGKDYTTSLRRNRHIQQLLTAKAIEAAQELWPNVDVEQAIRVTRFDETMVGIAEKCTAAAEAKWPGFRELVAELVAREVEFLEKAGPVA
jgi:hypothetical protein